MVDRHDDRHVEDTHVLDLAARLAEPLRTAASFPPRAPGPAACPHDPADAAVHLEARTVATILPRPAQPALAALDVKNFSAPMSARSRPPCSDLAVASARRSARTLLLPWQCSRMATVDERRPAFEGLEQVGLDRVEQQDGHRPAHLRSSAVMRLPSKLVATTIRPRRRRRSCRSEARARTAMTSEATVICHSSRAGSRSRGRPGDDRLRTARSEMSTTRGQSTPSGSMPSGLLWVKNCRRRRRAGCGRRRPRDCRRSGGG